MSLEIMRVAQRRPDSRDNNKDGQVGETGQMDPHRLSSLSLRSGAEGRGCKHAFLINLGGDLKVVSIITNPMVFHPGMWPFPDQRWQLGWSSNVRPIPARADIRY